MSPLPGTTPAARDDRGEPDEILTAALAAGDTAAALSRVLLARLVVPIVAMPATSGDAEMAVPALVDGSGARALPAFTGVASLGRWNADARPVPMPGARVVAGAVDEGYAAVIVDPAGPHPLHLVGPVLDRLADAARRLVSGQAGSVSVIERES
jgi:hypothetical protein